MQERPPAVQESPPEEQESPPDGSQVSQESLARQDNEDDDVLSASSYNHDQSSAQKVYLESNNSKKQLFLMCVGLTHGGSSVFDLNADPWNTQAFKI